MGLKMFLSFFCQCLIMNLLFQGRGYVATFDSVPFVGDPRAGGGGVGGSPARSLYAPPP